MAVDLATLKIEVDSSQVRKSAGDLDRLNAAAGRAESGAHRAGAASQRASGEVGGLGRQSRTAAGSVEHLGTRSQSTATSIQKLGHVANTGFIAVMGERAAASFIRTADKMKVMDSQLKSVTKSGEMHKDVYDQVLDIANKNQTAMGSTSELYVKTARSMEPLGKTTAQLMAFTDNLTATFRASGTSADDQAGAILQLSQAMGKGILNGDEFASISERAAMVMTVLADSLGVTTAELKDMGSDGELTAEKIFAAFQKVSPVLAKIEIPKTASGSMTVLNNKIGAWTKRTDEALGITNMLSDGILKVASSVDSISPAGGLALAAAFGIATLTFGVFSTALLVGGTTATAALATGIGEAAVATWGFTTALLANPITWVILGLVALGVAIYAVVQNWDVIKAKTIEVWDSIKAKTSEVWDSMSAKVSEVWDGVKAKISEVWAGITQSISNAMTAVAGVFSMAWAGITGAWESVKSAFVTGFHIINGLFVTFPILNFIFPIIGALLWLARNWVMVSTAAIAAWASISSAVSSGWNSVTSATSAAWTYMSDAVSKGWQSIKDSSSKVWGDVTSNVSKGGESVASAATSTWALVATAVSDGLSAVVGYVKSGWNSVVSAVVGNPVVKFYVQVWSAVWAYMSSLPSRFMQIGADVVNGLWNGLKAKWGEVTAWLSGAMSNLIAVSKASLDSHSPSRKFIQIGQDVMSGLAIGLKSYASKAVDEINAVSRSMLGVNFGTLKGKGADAVIDYLMKIRDITREIGELNKNGAVNPYKNVRSLNDDILKDPKKYSEMGRARVGQLQAVAVGADKAEATGFVHGVGVDAAKKLADMQREIGLIGLSEAAVKRLNFEREVSAELDLRAAYHTPELIAQGDAMKQKIMEEYDATMKLREEKERLAQADGESWGGAAKKSWDGFVKGAGNSADKMKGVFDNAFNGISGALGDLVTTGKADFGSLASSILSEMSKVLLNQAFSSLFGGKGGSGILSSIGSFFGFANGGAFSGGVQMFANGGAFSNSIASSPTAFGMSGGKMGVMGEAGPEAIMPLTRMAGGKLGVQAIVGGGGSSSGSDGGGGNTFVVNVVTNVQSGGESKTETKTSGGGSAESMKKFGEMMAEKAREVIVGELRQGGLLAS